MNTSDASNATSAAHGATLGRETPRSRNLVAWRMSWLAGACVFAAAVIPSSAAADEGGQAADPVVLLVESRGVDAASLRRAVSKRVGRPVLSLLDEGASSAPLFVSVSVRGFRVAIVTRPMRGKGSPSRIEEKKPRGGQKALVGLIAKAIETASQPSAGQPSAAPRSTSGTGPTAVAAREAGAAEGTPQEGAPPEAGRGERPRRREARGRRTARDGTRSAGREQDASEWPGGIVVEVIDPFRPSRPQQYASRLRIDSGVLDPWSSARLAYLTETIDPWGGTYRVGAVATSEVIDPFSPTARLNVGLLDPWVAAEAREPGSGLSRPRPFVP